MTQMDGRGGYQWLLLFMRYISKTIPPVAEVAHLYISVSRGHVPKSCYGHLQLSGFPLASIGATRIRTGSLLAWSNVALLLFCSFASHPNKSWQLTTLSYHCTWLGKHCNLMYHLAQGWIAAFHRNIVLETSINVSATWSESGATGPITVQM